MSCDFNSVEVDGQMERSRKKSQEEKASAEAGID
jgi:hypothetical protein